MNVTPLLTQWHNRLAPRITPGVAEFLLAVLVLLFLLWSARAFHGHGFERGANDRYLVDQALAVTLPAASRYVALAAACALPRPAETGWRERLCKGVATGDGAAAAKIAASQLQAVQKSLALPLRGNLQEQQKERLLARAGLRPLAAEADEGKTMASELAGGQADAYRRAYGLESGGAEETLASRPLACAMDWLDKAGDGQGRALSEVDARLLAAAVLAGRPEAVRDWAKQDNRKLPGFDGPLAQRCTDLGDPVAVVQRTASLMGKARASQDIAAKAGAARLLPGRAGWILTGYALLGLLLLKMGRHTILLPRFLPFGLMLWGLAGWASGVRLPDAWPLNWQVWFFPGMAAACGALWLLFTLLPLERWGWARATPRQTMASRAGYAGFVLLVGLGWWLLLDLSAHGDPKNRFLALYQQTYLFAAFLLVSLLPALRLGLARFLGRVYALLLTAQGPGLLTGWRRWLPWGVPTVLVLLPLITVFQHHRQLTSELLRLWFILGVSWFLFSRGERVARAAVGDSRKPLLRSLLPPLALFAGLLVVGQLVTDDQGPLLVTLYGSGVLAGGLAAMLLEEAGHRPRLALPVGMGITLAWIAAITLVLFTLGPLHGTTAERLKSLHDPYSAANDQMAIIHNFRASIPPGGYGLGDVPWCGEQPGGGCSGLPLQVQSDYTFAALQGVWGTFGTTSVLLLLFYWLSHLLRYHERVTDGRPDFSSPYAWSQAWTSWIALCWAGLLLAQVAVTVAGNLGWLPLSGITLPFVSYGAWSLLTNSFFLALTLNLLLPEESR